MTVGPRYNGLTAGVSSPAGTYCVLRKPMQIWAPTNKYEVRLCGPRPSLACGSVTSHTPEERYAWHRGVGGCAEGFAGRALVAGKIVVDDWGEEIEDQLQIKSSTL